MKDLLIDIKTENIIKDNMPTDQSLLSLADFFSILSDSTRIKIVSALSISSMCVNDISAVLGINQTTVSHQLKILRNQNVVSFIKQGKVSFYQLKNKDICDILLGAVEFLQ